MPPADDDGKDDAAVFYAPATHDYTHDYAQDSHHMMQDDDGEAAFLELMRKESTCLLCHQVKDTELIVEACEHRYCQPCLTASFAVRLAGKAPPTMACPIPGCTRDQLYPRTVRLVLSEAQLGQLEQMQMASFFASSDSFITCPNAKCGFGFEKVVNQVTQRRDVNETGIDNKPLSAEAVQHRDAFRFRCPQCSENFCSGCKETPYHLGFTCESYAAFKSASHCRYCDEPLTRANTSRGGGPGISGLVCIAPECQAKKTTACGKLLPCQHPCCGIKGESPCLPCLDAECPSKLPHIDSTEFCGICYTESLGAAPCVQLGCHHVFHQACVEKKLAQKWPGSRITFNFLNCPLCKQQMGHPALGAVLAPHLKMMDDVRAKAKQRLIVEGMDKDKDLLEPTSRYYQKPDDYALDKLAYYPCFKCKQPYFGGRGRCEAGQEQAPAADGPREEYDASHLVCGGCSDQGQECKKHGKEYMYDALLVLFSRLSLPRGRF